MVELTSTATGTNCNQGQQKADRDPTTKRKETPQDREDKQVQPKGNLKGRRVGISILLLKGTNKRLSKNAHD